MPNYTIDLYLVKTITNLHAGRGDSNYGIVDNEVQRDPVQNLPVIFSSSLKGAFRELLERQLGKGHEDTIFIFGNENKPGSTIQPGKYIFHEARLLALPVRSGVRPFLYASTPEILADLAQQLKLMKPGAVRLVNSLKEAAGISVTSQQPLAEESGLIDEFEAVLFQQEAMRKIDKLKKSDLLLSPLALFAAEDFKGVCERLPVIARNQLENGVSKNLFYEEVVPRQTCFTFFVERPIGNDVFHSHLSDLNMRVQIGANASIGYGVCKLERIQLT